MKDCIMSTILEKKAKDSEIVRIQTTSGSAYDGTIKDVDCMGVLFVASDKTKGSAYVLYTDIKKFILLEH